jgi:hypothetical protein
MLLAKAGFVLYISVYVCISLFLSHDHWVALFSMKSISCIHISLKLFCSHIVWFSSSTFCHSISLYSCCSAFTVLLLATQYFAFICCIWASQFCLSDVIQLSKYVFIDFVLVSKSSSSLVLAVTISSCSHS